MFSLSRLMYEPKSWNAPDEQNAPRSSVSKSEAASGALPPRIAAVSLSGVSAPLLFTVIQGYFLWKPATAWLTIPSSRAVKPFQKVIVTGSLADVEAELEPSVVSASTTRRPNASSKRLPQHPPRPP